MLVLVIGFGLIEEPAKDHMHQVLVLGGWYQSTNVICMRQKTSRIRGSSIRNDIIR
jgi:hypothetical protein